MGTSARIRQCVNQPLSLNTVEHAMVEGRTGGRIDGSHAIWPAAIRPDVSHNPRISLCANPHLLMTFCRQLPLSGHTQSSFNRPSPLPAKSSAWPTKCLCTGDIWKGIKVLWEPTLIMHTRPFRCQGHELVHGLQHFRRGRKKNVSSLPTCKKNKSVTFFI